MKTLTEDEFYTEAERRFGASPRDWRFVCPSCKTVQSAADLYAAGVKSDAVQHIIGYSCIGRHTSEMGCDWSLGGLFRTHTCEIVIDGSKKTRPFFELAEVEAPYISLSARRAKAVTA